LDIDTNFYKKRKIIIETYTIREILAEVCLNQKFWSINTKKIDDLLDIKEGVFLFIYSANRYIFVQLAANYKR
jgi:hypothetical protein